ncbi:MAG: M61 family metallopeptidase [Fidelibacterota bacterium]|nr:MAG: M61 family metallopeptidase [Candidatus Neomarinimicrobiota bacterium]
MRFYTFILPRIFTLHLILLMLSNGLLYGRITYTLSFEDRTEHYVSVELEVDGLRRGREYVDFKMATWTPGSYRIRDFSRNIVEMNARDGSRGLALQKLDKNTWRVILNGQRRAYLTYKVYAFEPTQRTSFVDERGAMLNGASVFIYPVGLESQESLVVINKPRAWRKVTSSLPGVGGSSPVFRAENYDVLVDSPIMMGNHTVLEFEAGGIPHQYAISGEGNYDGERLIADTRKIIEEIHEIFGSVPYEEFTIFLELRDSGGGGLEHQNSMHLIESRWRFSPEADYRRFLDLVAHELFHIYNVTRLRPQTFLTYDYERENYSTLLWFAEGFTSYYGRYLLRRADLISDDVYLQLVATDIRMLESTPGRLVQTLEEASFDAWIKYYQPNENSPNTTISYYGKGGLVGLALDLALRSATNGERSLDDVFRLLWERYVVTAQGYDFELIRSVCDSLAGRSLDDVYQYITTTAEIEWGPILEPFGLLLMKNYSSPEDSLKAYYGFNTRIEDDRLFIDRVVHDTPATRAGLSVGDELIAVDGFRIAGEPGQRILSSRSPDSEVALIVSRNGVLETYRVRPVVSPPDRYSILRVEPPAIEQEELYSNWLEIPWE